MLVKRVHAVQSVFQDAIILHDLKRSDVVPSRSDLIDDCSRSRSRVKVLPGPAGPTIMRCWAASILRSIRMLLPVFMSSPKYSPFSSVRELGFLEGKSAAVWYENSSHQE